ncbi:NTP transferase domain-containing protein [Pseudomonadota bacterium]|nr:NTP transferase domain-containing protein [Pseudomonadota bacterium]
MTNFDVIIPARLQSSRFPQKVLHKFYGLPMIEHVRRRALLIEGVSNVLVATCDNEIFELINSFGGEVVMTSTECVNGTERVSEAAFSSNSEYIVLLQGDEPCFYPQYIEKLISYVKQTEGDFYNLVSSIADKNILNDTSSVKCSLNKQNEITGCFRQTPFVSDFSFQKIFVKKLLGIMCFKKSFLVKLDELNSSDISMHESIEQLTLLENNILMRAVEVKKDIPSLNVIGDLIILEKEFKLDQQQKILKTIL